MPTTIGTSPEASPASSASRGLPRSRPVSSTTSTPARAASKAPVAISHTGCRALVDLPRNTRDSELKALADRGGVAGIYFMPFLRKSGQPHAEDLIHHLEHAVNVCGEDHVGIGTDGPMSRIELNKAYAEFQRKFYADRVKRGISAPGESADVFNLIPEDNTPRRFKILADDLSRRGWHRQDSRYEFCETIQRRLDGLTVRVFACKRK